MRRRGRAETRWSSEPSARAHDDILFAHDDILEDVTETTCRAICCLFVWILVIWNEICVHFVCAVLCAFVYIICTALLVVSNFVFLIPIVYIIISLCV